MSWKRIYCFFGKHKAAEPIDLKSDTFTNKKLVFCERCKKILYIGIFPPEHPNCLCTIQEFPE